MPLPLLRVSSTLGLLWIVFNCAPAHAVVVNVAVSGNVASVQVGDPTQPIADVTLSFDDASGLTAANLGVSAELIKPGSPDLLARLPAGTGVASGLPLQINIEPPAGGLSFRRRVHVEVHTHALSYTAGSPFRLFKAPSGGAFRDITNEVAPGSVRTRGTTGGFSQFLVLADLRPSSAVIAEKFSTLRAQVELLPLLERTPLLAHLLSAESALAQSQFADTIVALDAFRARVAARAGTDIPQEWVSGGAQQNHAGELLAGVSTLQFSVGVLRDTGT